MTEPQMALGLDGSGFQPPPPRPPRAGPPEDDWTVKEAREWCAANRASGVDCPCCGRRVRTYKRTISTDVAQALVDIYLAAGLEWCHAPEARQGKNDGDVGKLAHWGLVLESAEPRADGGRRGWWRVTPQGERFLAGTLRLPKYAHVYAAHVEEFSGPLISIQDALDSPFNLRDLMNR